MVKLHRWDVIFQKQNYIYTYRVDVVWPKYNKKMATLFEKMHSNYLLHEQQFYIDILCIGKAIENEVCA